MITSTSNSRIKEVVRLRKQAKERSLRGLFLTEGEKMFLEAPAQRVEQIFVSETFLRKNEQREEIRTLLEKLPHEEVSDSVFAYMSDTDSPQGVLCLIRQYQYTEEALLTKRTISAGAGNDDPEESMPEERITQILKQEEKASPGKKPAPLCLALEKLQDPGNLGTILRSAEGAGVTGILLSSDCVDIYNPKVIRSTMGSVYRVPFLYAEDQGDFFKKLESWKKKGICLYAAHLQGKNSYDREDYTEPAAFLIGNESRGLTQETAGLADKKIRIPMQGQVESLNAAVAASLLVFEAARQRRD